MARRAAELLAGARLGGTRLVDLPAALRPTTLAEAYAIQNALAALLGPVGGWKVGAAPGGGILVAPIPAAFIHRQSAAPAIPAPARLEVELALMLNADLPGRGEPYDALEVASALEPAHVVLEVLGHRFVAQETVSALTYLADGNGNAAVIVGDAIPGWRGLDLARLEVALSIDGVAQTSRGQGDGSEAVLDLLTGLANHAARHIGGLRAGQVVITGARLGPVAVAGGSVEASVNGAFHVGARVG